MVVNIKGEIHPLIANDRASIMKNGLFWLIITFVGTGSLLSLTQIGSRADTADRSLNPQVSDTTFIGLWKGVDESDVGYLSLENEGFAWFVIGQDTLGGEDFEQEGHRARMTYEIDYQVSPKSIDFVVFSKDLNLELGRLPGIFEFINTKQVRLSLNFTGNKRPEDFEKGDDMVTLERVFDE